LGAKFRRQHNLGPFFADFYCHEARLIIEADGGIHQEQKEQDATRDEWAITHGFIVLRFKNEKILDDIERVLSTIAQSLRPLSSQERGMGVRSNG
jgi:very-short-patch-repair endonuclease